jgi:hypothetical protein
MRKIAALAKGGDEIAHALSGQKKSPDESSGLVACVAC